MTFLCKKNPTIGGFLYTQSPACYLATQQCAATFKLKLVKNKQRLHWYADGFHQNMDRIFSFLEVRALDMNIAENKCKHGENAYREQTDIFKFLQK